MKKVLSVLLCLVMVLGITTVAFAGENAAEDNITEESTTEETTTEETTTVETTTVETTTEESTTEESTTDEPTTEASLGAGGAFRTPDGVELSWNVDFQTKHLEINGNGAMPSFKESAPWLEYNFHSVSVGEGVTSISTDAFLYAVNLKSVELADSVSLIAARAFYGCEGLENIDLNKVKAIGEMAFYGCTSVKEVKVPQTVTEIGNYAFGYCLEGDIELSKISGFTMSDKLNSVAGVYAQENEIPFTDLTPEAPSIKYLHANKACVTVFWNGTEGADSYEIYRKTKNTAFKKIADITDVNSTVYCDFTVKSGNKYTYSVAAVKDGYTSELTYTEDVTFKNLSTPKLVSATFIKEGVSVEWKTVSDAEGYRLYRRTETTDWTEIADFKGQQSSYLDKTVKSGETYIYTVKAYDGIYESGYDYKGVSAKFLAVPKLKKASNAAGGIKVTWEKVKGADGYIIGKKTNGGNWVKITQTGDVSSYTDKNVKAGNTYTYTVVPVSGTLAGFYNSKGVTSKYISKVTTKSVSNIASGVKVTWSPVKKCSGYIVYRKTADTQYKKIATVKGASVSSYVDKTAANGVKYTYTVKAYSGSYYSSYDSAGKTITFLKAPKLSSAVSGKKGVTLKWGKSSVADGYYVYRKTGTGKWVQLKKITDLSTVNFVDTTAKKGTTYTYAVKAYKGTYKSDYSKAITLKDKY